MKVTDILIDASYLVALGYPRDRNHIRAKAFAATFMTNMFIPDVVLVEAMYNLQRLGGTKATITYAKLLMTAQPQFVSLTISDFQRATELMEQYREVELDFVDCCLTALAERLDITKICTFDRRDFMIIRPQHIDYFELLPE
jgi:uncharacterized protein